MNLHPQISTGLLAFFTSCVFNLRAETATITIDADRPGPRISPTLYGAFFEDINFGADGGLYAELVINRSFEFPEALTGWTVPAGDTGKGTLEIRHEDPLNAKNPHYLRITSDGDAGLTLINSGFRGMGIHRGKHYDFSVEARCVAGDSPQLRVQLLGQGGRVLGSTRVEGFGPQWSQHTASLRADATDGRARLKITVEGRGTLDLDMVSLFPQNTWKNRPGGLRADLVQMLADMKPGFFRFPGGCIVEGSELDKRYQWKNTIGPVEERPLLINRWNYEFKHRSTPDYFQTFGLGFFEYFQLCEDIGAEPVPVLNCGMACQFNSGELVPLAELDPYIQDALDLVEFANGPVTSEWGAKRAAMGHPEPFHLKYLGIGNEQWGPQYIERYLAFEKVLKAKCPEIQLVSGSGPAPHGEDFDFLWSKLRDTRADIVDEHCYAGPDWFLDAATRYDDYDRRGPRVFMGEYAAQSFGICSPNNRNNLRDALAEAAFMTGFERNADVVVMSSYAPLFAHVDGWQWRPDLIWFDNLSAFPTPDYHVQRLFSVNRGDVALPVTLTDPRPAPPPAGRIGLATYKTSAEFKDIEVRGEGVGDFRAELRNPDQGWGFIWGDWRAVNESIRQADAEAADSEAFFGSTEWRDYTVTLKARKLEGDEGFSIIFRNNAGGCYFQWNLGGYGNTRHAILADINRHSSTLDQVDGSIESGRWYEVRITVQGHRVQCFLDGNLLQSADLPPTTTPGLFASASRDEASGEIILKVVNSRANPAETSIRLNGVQRLSPLANKILLTGDPDAVNSIDHPDRIHPVSTTEQVEAPEFSRVFPAHSLTILRFGIEEN